MKNIAIGQKVVADIGVNKDWVEYLESNEGEKDYYRDVYSEKSGCLIYTYGEECKIEGIDIHNETVTLSNDNIDDNDFPIVFTISHEQFKEDFQ